MKKKNSLLLQVLETGDERIEYTVRYGSERRRHLMIRVNQDGGVEVVLPPGIKTAAALKAAVDAVRRRADWILGHVRRSRERPLPTPPSYRTGETHFYLGQARRLDVLPSRSWEAVRPTADRLVVSCRGGDPARVEKLLQAWFRERAVEIFAERFAALVPGISWLAQTPAWGVRAMRRRWGSCSPSGFITLNTRLVQLPPACIDYVILHEIAHLRELNHGPHFYALLESLCPDWKTIRKRLREQGERLAG